MSATRTFEHFVTTDPTPRPGAEARAMTAADITAWLDAMDEMGWEFVGCAQQAAPPFQFWMFRKPYRGGS